MSSQQTIQLKAFCSLLDVPDRDVRYVLEEGYVPPGVAKRPSTGNRREFDPGQAFWLAVVVKLKQGGFKTRLAVDIAKFLCDAIRGATVMLTGDIGFQPFFGEFETDHRYLIEIADQEFVRLLTDAQPSTDGLHEGPWATLHPGEHPTDEVRPIVTLRLDLSRIASLLARCEVWSEPD